MSNRLDNITSLDDVTDSVHEAIRKHVMDTAGVDIDENLSDEQKEKATDAVENLSVDLAFKITESLDDWSNDNKSACQSMKALDSLKSHLEQKGQTKEAEVLGKVSELITRFGISTTAMVWSFYKTRGIITERMTKPHTN